MPLVVYILSVLCGVTFNPLGYEICLSLLLYLNMERCFLPAVTKSALFLLKPWYVYISIMLMGKQLTKIITVQRRSNYQQEGTMWGDSFVPLSSLFKSLKEG